MTKWRNRVNEQKQILNTDSSRSSGPAGTSATEFSYLKSQPIGKNPYQEEEIDDDETQSSPPIDAGKSTFTVSRTASSNSLRSTPGPPGNHPVRMAPPKIPLPENGSGVFTPTLSLNTNIPQGTSTPSEFAGHSYFSPSNDSPISTRSNSQQSFSQFPRQHTSGGGWPHEDTRHRTVPVMARAPSREGPEPLHGYSNTRPSLPAMATSKSSQQQMISQSRLRSASTPDITNPNAPGARRPGANQPYLQAENVPVPPIPPHMVQGRPPINRSQTTSPTDAQLPVRSATQSPSQQQRGHRQHPERVRPSFESGYADRPNQHGQTTEADPTSEDYMPNQLKVRIWFHPHPSHVTIVVPTVIKHRSLTDRIDSKMAKVTSASIAKGSARLRYKDSDNDYVTVASDEDIHEAIEDWGTQSRDQLLEGSVPDFELYWYEA